MLRVIYAASGTARARVRASWRGSAGSACSRTRSSPGGAPPSRAPRSPSSPSAISATTTATPTRADDGVVATASRGSAAPAQERHHRRPRGLERPGQSLGVEAQLVAGVRRQRPVRQSARPRSPARPQIAPLPSWIRESSRRSATSGRDARASPRPHVGVIGALTAARLARAPPRDREAVAPGVRQQPYRRAQRARQTCRRLCAHARYRCSSLPRAPTRSGAAPHDRAFRPLL